jgi:hypothetical protein
VQVDELGEGVLVTGAQCDDQCRLVGGLGHHEPSVEQFFGGRTGTESAAR